MHSSQGRADCVVRTNNNIYVFEFKVDKSAREALEQIEEKGYANPYLAEGKTIIKIGAGFDSEKRQLFDWAVELNYNSEY